MVKTRSGLSVLLILAALAGTQARGEDFYKGKRIDIVVGATPSGSFDLIARSLARHMGRHIPGGPAIIVQNMPGAGSLTALFYLDANAPKDGTVLGVFLPGIITQSFVTPDKIGLDLKKLAWVGVVSADNTRVCYGYGPDGVKSWDDLMRRTKDRPFIMGTTGTGASNYINGQSLVLAFQANLKIIMGFPGSTELRLAVERGELDGDCGGFVGIPPDWISSGKAHPFVRFAAERAPGIPASAVYVGDMAKTAEQKQLLGFLYCADKLGRPLVMSRQVPPERLQIMRAAFDETMRDPAFLADMERQQEPVNPVTGVEAERLYNAMSQVPAEIVAKARKIYE
jgi:tripartite-type tricarboxylate transporter receptor subunit TctC